MTDTQVADPELVHADVVDPAAARKEADREHRMELDRRQQEDVARLADHALATPGTAGRDEFIAMAMQARILSMSAAAPDSIKGRPAVALHVVMLGRALGLDPAVAVEQIDIIGENGKERPSLSPELLNARIKLLGLGRMRKAEVDFTHCTAQAITADGEILGEEIFTWEDAQNARLADKKCKSGNEHAQDCKCKYNWKTYPKRMLWWRAAGYCADDNFPEAGIGLYSPEELGSMVDAEGRPIDAASVELPPGFDPEEQKRKAATEAEASMTDDQRAERWALQERVFALPDDAKATLAERWKGMQRLRGIKLADLPADAFGIVAAVLKGLEGQTKTQTKGEWDPDAAVAAVRLQEAEIIARLLCPTAWGASEPDVTPDDTTPARTAEDATAAESEADPAKADQPTLADAMDDKAVLDAAGDDQVQVTVALVKAMTPQKVDAELGKLGLDTQGNADARRQRLAIAYLRRIIRERGE